MTGVFIWACINNIGDVRTPKFIIIIIIIFSLAFTSG